MQVYWDHPRGCGAHQYVLLQPRFRSGSSPRVRGSLVDLQCQSLFAGIIPAGAGLTYSINLNCKSSRDHPRGCGAHYMTRAGIIKQMGSSPRVRGSPGSAYQLTVNDGIIPAGAGLTSIPHCK